MSHQFLRKNNWLKFLPRQGRTAVYTLVLLLVAFGHYFFTKLSLESFNYLCHSVISMLCFLCLAGVSMLMLRKRPVRENLLFVLMMLVAGLGALFLLVKGLMAGGAGMAEYGSITFPLVLWGCVLAYPVVGLVLMLRQRGNWRKWSENSPVPTEKRTVEWLGDYIFGNLVIIFSWGVFLLSDNPRTLLMHYILFLFFFLYGFYRVLFNPYASSVDYVKVAVDEEKARTGERVGADSGSQGEDEEVEPSLMPENDLDMKSAFSDKLPDYKNKLEHWMQTEKPHLRKDFKLTDAMEILPLNRSYLSRLFNEGYGESFYHFVMRYRIRESKQLLQSRPDLTITSIADLSGFSSLSVYCRAFAKETNCSPMQWRKKGVSDNLKE